MEAKKIVRVRKPDRHTAAEKCAAVLSVWTERRKAGSVCREQGITWAQFSQWQQQAMEGMLRALTPRQAEATSAPRLHGRLEKLLQGRMKLAEKRNLRDSQSRRPKVLDLLAASDKKGPDRKEG